MGFRNTNTAELGIKLSLTSWWPTHTCKGGDLMTKAAGESDSSFVILISN
ncbi:OLC1v1035680C1 [Oldenlandia corymbosa var. corymbosa]|uniref:OLC1v1035680C1 n=1 Tax=Oldenlandia corymbosa var. corymbosa TaxID=529605 RepID=A0AAV1CU96_OLDCO|nr:OLC1v1035680C1 [Oldenlandia corymbosa var. corymbosa]